MRSMSLAAAAEAVSGRLLGENRAFAEVSTDSRAIPPAALFIALRGERFDGHAFLEQAVAAGAIGLMIEEGALSQLPEFDGYLNCPRILVADCRLALGRLAQAWRQASPARLVAVTGSNGKTSLKEMLKAILGADGTQVLATQGNLNNDIGLPLTLLRLENEPLAVVEMGANHPGEIDYLSRLAMPDVAVLNNAGRAHLEGFGSLEGVARAKAEILNGLKPGGGFVYPADSPWASLWQGLIAEQGGLSQTRGQTLGQTLGFGLSSAAQVRSPEPRAELVWGEEGFASCFSIEAPGLMPGFNQGQPLAIHLALPGEHNRQNALAAAAAALLLEIPPEQIARGLAGLRPVPGRLNCQRLAGAWLVDDSYNANPDSMRAAIEVLASAPAPARTTLVLGDMGELGPDALALHREVGARAREAGIQRLFVTGALSRATLEGFEGQDAASHVASHVASDDVEARHFSNHEALAEALVQTWQPGEAILVKGSRAAAMDLVVKALALRWNQPQNPQGLL